MTENKEQDRLSKVMEQANELSYKKHYFWLDRRLVDVKPDILSKKALLLYLIYARSANPKHQQCSFASYNAAKQKLGLPKYAVDSAREELIEKYFIKLRPDIKPRYFKTQAVEVLDFPSIGNDSFSASNIPRALQKAESVFSLPSNLIDKGQLKGIYHFELRILLFLYSMCSWKEYLGIDFQFLHKVSQNAPKGVIKTNKYFGSGFQPSIEREPCFQVATHHRRKINKKVINAYGWGIHNALSALEHKGFFHYTPVVIWEDPDDCDIAEVRREVFQGMINFAWEGSNHEHEFRLAPLSQGERVIWILRPSYPAKNSDYESYRKQRREQQEEAAELYGSKQQGEQD